MNNPHPARVLIVDDRPENLLAMRELLRDMEADVHTASSGNEALALMLQREYAVVLMDVRMPEMDGLETTRLARGSSRTRHIPIVFVTADNPRQARLLQGYELGAVDFLYKPIEPVILRSKVKVFIDLFNLSHALADKNRQLEKLTGDLRQAAHTDTLTGLHNRRYLTEHMSTEMTPCSDKEPPRTLGLAMVDLDHFKRINDSHGHDTGDAVLEQVAARLKLAAREQDVVVRWGGEEFLLLLRDVPWDQLGSIADRICKQVRGQSLETPSGPLMITCSVGFAPLPAGAARPFTWEEAVSIADQALFLAKRGGRDRAVGVTAYCPNLGQAGRKQVLKDLQGAAAAGLVELSSPQVAAPEDTKRLPIGAPAEPYQSPEPALPVPAYRVRSA